MSENLDLVRSIYDRWASGLQIGASGASVFKLDAGKVKRLVAYLDRNRALADLGPAE